MDVDADMDLICQFRTMNTNDKDHLISEFKRLSNTELTNEGCCFFLDLAEWNLNTALWAYYEYDAPVANELPLMKFICDITIGEGESVPPNTKFTKTWRVKNIGVKRWPYGCQLKLVNSNIQQRASTFEQRASVKALENEESSDISIELMSPEQCGIYQSQYRLFTPNGTPFGDPIWLILKVEQDGILGITQQLNNVNMFGMQTTQSNSNFQGPNEPVFKTETNSDLMNNNNLMLNNNNLNPNTIEEDKRPDFYDDMFS